VNWVGNELVSTKMPNISLISTITLPQYGQI